MLISIFGPVGPKLEKSINKFSSLNLLMLNETTLEMCYFQLNFGKNKIEMLFFLRTGN